MGNCVTMRESARQAREEVEYKIITWQGAESSIDLQVDRKLKDALPFPGIKSRLSSAIVLSFIGRRKKVVMRVIMLSKSCRAYIITQGCLPGFLLAQYQNLEQLLRSELLFSREFNSPLPDDISQDELTVIEEKLNARSHMTFEEKISIFKKNSTTEESITSWRIYLALVTRDK